MTMVVLHRRAVRYSAGCPAGGRQPRLRHESSSSTTPSCRRSATADERDRVSSRGWALGYLGGAVLLVAEPRALPRARDAFGLTEARGRADQPAVGGRLVGRLHDHPGRGTAKPPTPAGAETERGTSAGAAPHAAASASSAARCATCAATRKTLLFLLAYLLYNDGIQTVIALAAVYIEKELLLDTSVIDRGDPARPGRRVRRRTCSSGGSPAGGAPSG